MLSVGALIGTAAVLYFAIRANCTSRPMTCIRVTTLTSSPSPSTAEDPHQGVGGGQQRARARAKDEPHLRYVPITLLAEGLDWS